MAEPRIPIPQEDIAAFCARWQIVELALFGSVLRDDFRPDSDVDVLVRFAPDVRYRFGDYMTMEDELEAVFRRRVDLVSRKAVEQSPNPYRKTAVLKSAQVIYDAT